MLVSIFSIEDPGVDGIFPSGLFCVISKRIPISNPRARSFMFCSPASRSGLGGLFRLIIPLVMTALLSAENAPAWVTDVRNAVREELAAEALPLAHQQPAVDLESTYDPALGRMQGTMRIALFNDTAEPWPDIGFVLHANNAASYHDSSITIGKTRVDGKIVDNQLVEDGRGVLLPLAHPLAPGAWAACELDFVTLVPEGGGRAGLLTRDKEAHHLYSWLPEPAIRRGNWHFPAIPVMSDPSFVRACDYRWRLHLPEKFTLVAGGLETRQADGSWLVRAPRTRNLVAWLSDQPVQIMSLTPTTGPTVRVAFLGKYTIQAAFCLSAARDTLAIASEAFGAYPRRSYDVVFTTFSEAVGGMEASGLTFVHQPLLKQIHWRARDPLTDQDVPLMHTVIHEVMHSWWYDQVGNDTGDEPWLDESLTEWSSMYVFERLRDREVMKNMASTRLSALPLLARSMVPLNSAGDKMNDMQFGILVYHRGPLLYEALRAEVGDEIFFTALRNWYRTHSGDVVSRSDWDTTFLSLLPENRRADFAKSWIEGIDDPVPASLDQILPEGDAEEIRSHMGKRKKPVTKPESMPESNEETQTEAKPETKTEAKPETKAESPQLVP